MIDNYLAQHLIQKPFIPHPILKSGHLQTMVAAFASRQVNWLQKHNEMRYFTVGSNIRVLAWCSWQSEPSSRPCVLMIHGMEGSSESPYMIGTAEKALAAGFNVVRLNLRNCGKAELCPAFYNAGLTNDIRCILSELIEKDGVQELYLVGFSLGGNMSLKYAGEESHQIPGVLKGLVAISPSVHLPSCIDALEKGSNFIYHTHFVRSLKRSLRRKSTAFPDYVDATYLRHIWTLRKFDDVYTAPYSGYRDSAEYYERASSQPYIRSVTVPTLIIHAKDDPFIPADPLENPHIQNNRNVLVLTPNHGGHVGFIAAEPENNCRRWAEHRVIQFIQTLREIAKIQPLESELRTSSLGLVSPNSAAT